MAAYRRASTGRYRSCEVVGNVRTVHELSICAAIAGIVEQHAESRPVEIVRIDVGHLRQVVPETLQYSWELVVADTPLAGSVIEVNHVPLVVRCDACGESTELDTPVLRCPCGSTDVTLTSGEELLVRSLELVDA